MIFAFLVNMENTIAIYSYSTPWSLFTLNSLFWSPPTAVHRFDISDMAVPGLYISWVRLSFKCQRCTPSGCRDIENKNFNLSFVNFSDLIENLENISEHNLQERDTIYSLGTFPQANQPDYTKYIEY